MQVDREIAYCREKAAQFRALAAEYAAMQQPAMATRLEEIAKELESRAKALDTWTPAVPSEINLPRQYRLYFLDHNRRIVGRDDFLADNDVDALAIATMLSDACADRCVGFDLWQCERRVESGPPAHKAGTPETIAAAVQEIVLERELAIRSSVWAIADSVRLLEETGRLLAQRRGG